jgi:hypothetical protein
MVQPHSFDSIEPHLRTSAQRRALQHLPKVPQVTQNFFSVGASLLFQLKALGALYCTALQLDNFGGEPARPTRISRSDRDCRCTAHLSFFRSCFSLSTSRRRYFPISATKPLLAQFPLASLQMICLPTALTDIPSVALSGVRGAAVTFAYGGKLLEDLPFMLLLFAVNCFKFFLLFGGSDGQAAEVGCAATKAALDKFNGNLPPSDGVANALVGALGAFWPGKVPVENAATSEVQQVRSTTVVGGLSSAHAAAATASRAL